MEVILAYICATSIWTYDGNNLEALAAKRTCAPRRTVHGATVGSGICSGCEEAATGTNTVPCVPQWRELSRNKSRDEREMWPNRSSHTDTVSRGCWRERNGYPAVPFIVPFATNPLTPYTPMCRGQNFQVISVEAIQSVSGPLVGPR